MRTFRIALPSRKRKADAGSVETSEKPQKLASTQALGKTALFTSAHGPKNETYQRVLRASPIQSTNEARISAVASGLAPENEVITFQPVANALTSAIDEISRVSLGKAEAADVDVMGVPRSGHTLAYCTDDAVFIQRLPYTKGSQIEPPSKLYQPPELTTATPPSERPRFRALRLLTPKHILVLQNRPGRAGARLLILAINKDDSQGYVTLWKFLKSSTKTAVGLDTCRLSESEDGARQYIVAVAGQDSSIELLTLDYVPFKGFAKFRPYAHMRDIHTGPLTKLIFSNFIGPSDPISKDTPVQSVRLASVGVDQTVVVHTFPLRLHRNRKSKKPRYVLIPPSSAQVMQTTFSVLIAIFVAVIAAFLTQVFAEIRGAVPPTLGAPDWLSPELREKFGRPYISSNESTLSSASAEVSEALSSAISAIEAAPSHITIPSIETIENSFSDIVAENSQLETPKAIVVRDAGSDLSAEMHHDADLIKEETLKKWEDLTAHQKRGGSRSCRTQVIGRSSRGRMC